MLGLRRSRVVAQADDVPPLRDRAKDIPLLAEHFARESGLLGPLSALIGEETMTELLRYRWPGNVRELRNYVQATVAMGEATLPSEGDLAEQPQLEGLRQGFAALLDKPYGDARTALVREFELHYLEELMKRTSGNVALAARGAQMARSHLNELLRRHGIR